MVPIQNGGFKMAFRFQKSRRDTLLFGKTFVYTEVILLNFKMAPFQNGGCLYYFKGRLTVWRFRHICLHMTSKSRDFVYI